MLTRLRPAKINYYLKYMAGIGFPSGQVLDGTGISPRNLADLHYLVEISKYIRVISNIVRLSGSASLAFELGKNLSLGDLGILGYSVMTCDNTDEATALWHKFNPVFFGNLIEVSYEKINNQILLSYLPFKDIREDLLQFLIEEKICYDIALQRLIGIDKFPMDYLSLSYPEPTHVACYHETVSGPIEFSAPHNSLLLSSNAMTIPLRGYDRETHEHCLERLNEVFDSIQNGSTLTRKVQTILYENLNLYQGASEVAEQLCLSDRTLHRKLRKEGTNFSELSLTTRLEAIKNLLATTNLESKEIAERVGFSDVRSLRRFFKAHTEKTIQQFRIETLPDG